MASQLCQSQLDIWLLIEISLSLPGFFRELELSLLLVKFSAVPAMLACTVVLRPYLCQTDVNLSVFMCGDYGDTRLFMVSCVTVLNVLISGKVTKKFFLQVFGFTLEERNCKQ